MSAIQYKITGAEKLHRDQPHILQCLLRDLREISTSSPRKYLPWDEMLRKFQVSNYSRQYADLVALADFEVGRRLSRRTTRRFRALLPAGLSLWEVALQRSFEARSALALANLVEDAVARDDVDWLNHAEQYLAEIGDYWTHLTQIMHNSEYRRQVCRSS